MQRHAQAGLKVQAFAGQCVDAAQVLGVAVEGGPPSVQGQPQRTERQALVADVDFRQPAVLRAAYLVEALEALAPKAGAEPAVAVADFTVALQVEAPAVGDGAVEHPEVVAVADCGVVDERPEASGPPAMLDAGKPTPVRIEVLPRKGAGGLQVPPVVPLQVAVVALVVGQVAAKQPGAVPAGEMAQFALRADAPLAEQPGGYGGVVVGGQIEVVGQRQINAVLAGGADVGKQEPGLALVGDRELHVGQPSQGNALDPQHGASGGAEHLAVGQVQGASVDSPTAVARLAAGEPGSSQPNVTVPLALDRVGVTAQLGASEDDLGVVETGRPVVQAHFGGGALHHDIGIADPHGARRCGGVGFRVDERPFGAHSAGALGNHDGACEFHGAIAQVNGRIRLRLDLGIARHSQRHRESIGTAAPGRVAAALGGGQFPPIDPEAFGQCPISDGPVRPGHGLGG